MKTDARQNFQKLDRVHCGVKAPATFGRGASDVLFLLLFVARFPILLSRSNKHNYIVSRPGGLGHPHRRITTSAPSPTLMERKNPKLVTLNPVLDRVISPFDCASLCVCICIYVCIYVGIYLHLHLYLHLYLFVTVAVAIRGL